MTIVANANEGAMRRLAAFVTMDLLAALVLGGNLPGLNSRIAFPATTPRTSIFNCLWNRSPIWILCICLRQDFASAYQLGFPKRRSVTIKIRAMPVTIRLIDTRLPIPSLVGDFHHAPTNPWHIHEISYRTGSILRTIRVVSNVDPTTTATRRAVETDACFRNLVPVIVRRRSPSLRNGNSPSLKGVVKAHLANNLRELNCVPKGGAATLML
jgi:hypothetical protein